MKTYLLCLRKNEFRGLQAEISISDAAAPLGLEQANCKNFNDAENFFRCLSEILKNDSQVILAVDTEVFLTTKKLLCSVLSLNCVSNGIISELTAPDSPDRESHCLVPENAEIFPTEDGLFSGFAVKKENRSIIFLPLDNKRTSQCIDSFYNFLNGTAETEQVPENTDNDLTTIMNSISESAVDACRILKDMGFKAALSVSPAAEKLYNLLPSMEEIKFFPSCLERKNITPKNHAANLAKEAAERSGAKIGASITNAFKVQGNEESKVFICVAVADNEAAKVKKIYAQPDESPLALTACALNSVLDMIKGQAVRGKTILIEESSKEASDLSPSVEKRTRKKLLISTICAGAAALALCLGIAVSGIFIAPNPIPVSSNSGTSSDQNSDSNSSSSSDNKHFWDFLFNPSNDDEQTGDNSDTNTPDGDDEEGGSHSSGNSSSGSETPSTPGSNHGSNTGDPDSEGGVTPTEQPSGETPSENEPTEGGSEPTEKPTEEQPSETQPTETTEPPTEPPTETEPPSSEPPTEDNTAPSAQEVSEASAE